MTDPTPLEMEQRESDPFVADALASARETPAWPAYRQTALYQGLEVRRVRSRHRAQLLAVAAVAAVLTVAANWALRALSAQPAPSRSAAVSEPERNPAPRSGAGAAPRWDLIELAEVGTIEAFGWGSVDRVDFPGERQLRVHSGMLRAHISPQLPSRPVVVVTPHLRIVVIGTRFDVSIEQDVTVVHLLEGRVRAESGLRSVTLEPGDSIRSDDPRLATPTTGVAAPPPAPPVPPAFVHPPAPRVEPPRALAPTPRGAMARCGDAPALQARIACYARVAAGNGLAAESALLTLGWVALEDEQRPDRAVEHWSRYRSRFPDGTFAPEASLAILETLLASGRVEEAIGEAEQFERRFGSDPRAGEVTLARVELLCRTAGGAAQARELLELLAHSPQPRLRQASESAQRRCREMAGEPDTTTGETPAAPGWLPSRDIRSD